MSSGDWQQGPNQWGSTPPQAPPGQWPGSPYPAAPPVSYSRQGPSGTYYDDATGLFLPNGTTLATPGRRIGAWFLSIPLVVVTLGIGYLIWGIVVWGRGQTPALQVLGMRCWRPETGRVAGWWWMALREIVGRFVENLLSIITELLSFIFMLARPDRRTLHDMIAGTIVLHDPNKVLG